MPLYRQEAAEGLQDIIEDYINENLERIVIDHKSEVKRILAELENYRRDKNRDDLEPE